MHIELDGEWDDPEIRAGLSTARPFPVWIVPIGIVILTTMAIMTVSGGSIGAGEVLFLAVVAVAAVIFTIVILPRQISKAIDIPLLKGPVTGLVTDEALAIESRDASSTAHWSQFRSIKFNSSAAVLATGQQTHQLVLRNWFPDQQSWDTFTASAPALIERHRHSTPIMSQAAAGGLRRQPGSGTAVRFGGPFNVTEHHRVMARMSPARRYGIAVVVLGALLTILSAISVATGSGETSSLGFGLMAVGFGLLVVFGLPAVKTRLAARGTTAAGLTGTADDLGIDLSYESGRSGLDWSSFVSFVRTDDGVGLMLNGQAGIVIVRSWFGSESDWRRFIDLVEQHVAPDDK